MEIPHPKRVLILCTGNSCRSQIAEALWNHLAPRRWQAFSAGSQPGDAVYPHAITVLAEMGLDIRKRRPKSIDAFAGQTFDLVVTVCDAANQACPVFPSAARRLHWPFDDPPGISGSEQDRLAATRRVRDEIAARIRAFLDQPELACPR